MEKRRRARINQSLAVLKALIVEASTKSNKAADGSKQKHVKLEKAGKGKIYKVDTFKNYSKKFLLFKFTRIKKFKKIVQVKFLHVCRRLF